MKKLLFCSAMSLAGLFGCMAPAEDAGGEPSVSEQVDESILCVDACKTFTCNAEFYVVEGCKRGSDLTITQAAADCDANCSGSCTSTPLYCPSV